jgi:dihydropteroate synthase
LGPSRKRFLQQLVGKPSRECDAATAAACCVATLQGVHLLRVHAPGAVHDAVRVAAALRPDAPRRA